MIAWMLKGARQTDALKNQRAERVFLEKTRRGRKNHQVEPLPEDVLKEIRSIVKKADEALVI